MSQTMSPSVTEKGSDQLSLYRGKNSVCSVPIRELINIEGYSDQFIKYQP